MCGDGACMLGVRVPQDIRPDGLGTSGQDMVACP